jgi:CubicO group peptidase (beta-lactamase class C family)
MVCERYLGQSAPGTPASDSTLWPLASISKVYTAAAIVRLIELGELTFSLRASAVLPDFTQGGRERITLRQLLTHTSGLIYESPEMAKLLADQRPYDDIIAGAYRAPLLFAPGTAQRYSDYGYAIAAEMAAAVTGTPFVELVRTLVLEPAGLGDTYMPSPAEVAHRIAYVTGVLAEGTDGAMYNSSYARALAHPAFGTLATVRDLLAFGLLYAPGGPRRLHSRAGLRAMTTDQTGGDFPGEVVFEPAGIIHAWGAGFMIKGRTSLVDLASPESFGHGGASGCMLWIDPSLDLTIAFASNLHLNLGEPAWIHRLDRVLNVVMAELS